MKKCRQCQAENPDYSPYCGMCGSELPPAVTGSSPEATRPVEVPRLEIPVEEYQEPRHFDRSSLAYPGGVLIIISGVIVILAGIVTIALGTYVGTLINMEGMGGIYAVGVGIMAGGVITIFAGRYAMRGRHWALALVGCVISMLCGSILLILGVIGLVFICVARNDFLD